MKFELIDFNKTALHLAVENENFDILIQLLMSKKDIDINAKSVKNLNLI